MNNIVLTDCDGVLLNWRDSFDSWMMRQHGIFATGDVRVYDQTERYEDEEIWKKIVEFNVYHSREHQNKTHIFCMLS